MRLVLFSLCLTCFISKVIGMNPDLLAGLRAEVERISANVPANAGTFITDVSATSIKGDGITNMNGVVGLARSWKLPEDAVQRFRSAMFSTSLAFQSFQVTIPAFVDGATSFATMKEVVGVARNNGGQIQMAYAMTAVKGRLIGQFDTIAYKKCKRTLFVKRCKHGKKSVPRGFSAAEINTITRALRGTAYTRLRQEARNFFPSRVAMLSLLHAPVTGPNIVPLNTWHPAPVDPTFDFTEFPFVESETLSGDELINDEFIKLDPNSNQTIDEIFPPQPDEIYEAKRAVFASQDFGSAVSGVTESFSKIVSAIQMLKSESSSQIVNQFMGPDNGFANLKQHCQVQRLQGMLPEYLPAFSERLLQRLNIPNSRRDDFVNTLADIPFIDLQQVMDYDMVFNINKGGDCKYVSLLVERRPDGKLDWLIADFQANFKLAPNVFIVRKAKSIAGVWSKSSDKFKIVPRGITDADLEFVFKWMQLISFKRFADLLGLVAPDPKGL